MRSRPAVFIKADELLLMRNPDPTPRVSADRLRTFISQAFEKVGVPAGDAGVLAALITEAHLRGTDTHWVFRLPLYVRRIKAGGIHFRPNIPDVAGPASTALLGSANAL